MPTKILPYLWSFLLVSCVPNNVTVSEEDNFFTIAFGSCSHQDSEQTLWQPILQNNPDIWIWMGDNIYADTEDMNLMKEMYDRQKQNSDYTKLREGTPVYGIWDDHDYGASDGGKEYPQKDVSQKLMLGFLDVTDENEAWNRKGGYQSYMLSFGSYRIKLIFLDTRYFRDELEDDSNANNRYLPNEDGDILGEVQWLWLENELSESNADFHIIGSSTQLIAEEHGFEKWANFPKARTRFFDLISRTKPKRAIVISGDRHIAEISTIEIDSLPYPLYDFTSSGMTHTWSTVRDEPNRHRLGKLIAKKNFGIIKIDNSSGKWNATFQIRGEADRLYLEYDLPEW